jgi:pSer/pThr/pTyr-binding forkhead associated (FHA) protein
MIKLVISDNEGTTTVVPLARDEISIGRKEGNTIRLTERNISRDHCRLQRHNGSYVIHDLRSYNGVVLNGQRVVGESPVKPGDELRIGDYTLQVQLEARAPADDTEADATRVAPISRPPSAARLVVLTPPLAGAEFALPERGELRLGRAPELDISLDHRSVSREHAKIACDGGQARIIDSGGVNGVVVNREKVTEARLAPGDVIELGDVLVRYVGAGEQYVFDPADARALGGARAVSSRKSQMIGLVSVLVTIVVAIIIVRSGQEPAVPAAHSVATGPKTAVTPSPERGAAAADPSSAQAASQAAEGAHFAESLEACRQANEAGRYAEAIAHANAALKARPEATEAQACQEAARENHEQEQIYVRAKAALQAGDSDAAWKELASLSPNAAVRQRVEVEAVIGSVARERVALAQALLRKHPDQAAEIASGVLLVDALPSDVVAQAQTIADRAAAAHPGKGNRAEPAARVANLEPRPKPAVAARPQPVHAGDKSAMETATACLARGDNACVVRTLNGRAQSAQELGLLIETYRAMGDTGQAYRHMATYVQRFPAARRAEAYRQMLERQGQ